MKRELNVALREEGEMTINSYPRKQTTTKIQRVLRHHGWLREVGPSELFLVEKHKEHMPCFPRGNTGAVEWSARLLEEVMSNLWEQGERLSLQKDYSSVKR